MTNEQKYNITQDIKKDSLSSFLVGFMIIITGLIIMFSAMMLEEAVLVLNPDVITKGLKNFRLLGSILEIAGVLLILFSNYSKEDKRLKNLNKVEEAIRLKKLTLEEFFEKSDKYLSDYNATIGEKEKTA